MFLRLRLHHLHSPVEHDGIPIFVFLCVKEGWSDGWMASRMRSIMGIRWMVGWTIDITSPTRWHCRPTLFYVTVKAANGEEDAIADRRYVGVECIAIHATNWRNGSCIAITTTNERTKESMGKRGTNDILNWRTDNRLLYKACPTLQLFLDGRQIGMP